MGRLRTYFLTGLIVVAPVAITIWLLWTFVQWVDSWVIPYVPSVYNPNTYLPFAVPGAGLLIAILGIALIGFLTANFIGRTVVGFGERLLHRMPVVRSLYRGIKQIFETVLSDKETTFRTVGLVEYPRKGLWSLVFIAAEARGEVRERLSMEGEPMLSVFLPTTPNPTSGYLLFVKTSDVIVLEMSVEDGAKLVISAGLVAPDYQAKLASLAEAAHPGGALDDPQRPAGSV